MRVVLDTNVFISGVFFRGAPYEILGAWRDGRVDIMLSPAVFAEYHRVGQELARGFPGVALAPLLELLLAKGKFVEPAGLSRQVCEDPDDDKFLACALTARCRVIVSGDKHLIRVTGYRGIQVIRPRRFVEQYLSGRSLPK